MKKTIGAAMVSPWFRSVKGASQGFRARVGQRFPAMTSMPQR